MCAQLKAGGYQAPPVRRVDIPKGGGKTRPLGVPTVADRLMQRAVARILNAVFEQDFLGFSYGFRPGRNPDQALRALRSHMVGGKVRHVYEADILGYFNNINHRWMREMVAHRIADPVILRLIGKWLRAGVMEKGVVVRTEQGTPQGGPISPILANVYLHYVLDLWFEKQFKPYCQGEVYLTRFADDFVKTGITRFLRRKLKLAVNEKKSRVVKTNDCLFLGFTFRGVKLRWSEKAFADLKYNIRRLTGRSWGVSMAYRLDQLGVAFEAG